MAPTSSTSGFRDGDGEDVDVLAGYVVGVFGTEPVRRVAVPLEKSGADVLGAVAEDASGVRRLFDTIARGGVDAVALLDPAAASEVVAAMHRLRLGGEMRTALRGRTIVVGIDRTVGVPLAGSGIEVSTPGASDVDPYDAVVRLVIEQIPVLRGRQCVAAGRTLDVRSQAVVIDGELRQLPTSAMALLRALAQQPGHVVSRENLLARLPGEKVSGHAVDVAIGRLRTALGDPAIVATVVKRGYRLAVA